MPCQHGGCAIPGAIRSRVSFRDDKHFAENAAQIERRRREIFLEAALAIEENPHHVLDVDKAEYMVFPCRGIDRDSGTLRRRKGAHHFVQVGFHGQGVRVRPGTMISRTWICASSMALRMNFSSPAASSPRFARLLDLDLQLLRGMCDAVAVRRRDSHGFHDRPSCSIQHADRPTERTQEPAETAQPP